MVTAVDVRHPTRRAFKRKKTPAIRRTAVFSERVASAARPLDNAADWASICQQSHLSMNKIAQCNTAATNRGKRITRTWRPD